MPRHIAHASALVVMLALSGCPSLPDLEWEGEHVRFYADDPEQVCGGTLEYLDHRAGQLKARTGATHTIDYYWLPEGVESVCPNIDGIVGCADGHEVFSQWVPDQHELVHTMSSMPTVLQEGLATHWGDPWPLYTMAPRERLYELLESTPDDLSRMDEYARAAHFMAYLSETHGWESLVRLDASAGVELSRSPATARIKVASPSSDAAARAPKMGCSS